ncbi:MAG: NAD(+) diphosphatase [Treponema sp.]|nr:NAD(+) diphosphatase [Treponema sp.]
MPMISNIHDNSPEFRFILHENNIVLQNGNLPDEQVLRKCLMMNAASDWFAEKELGYAALSLEDESPLPAGCEEVPLRQFFFENSGDERIAGLSARAKTLFAFRRDKRFCSRCGGQLNDDRKFTARYCVKCRKLYFPQLEPAVIVVVRKDDEILLENHLNRNDGVYSCIAGFVEAGESAEHAVHREVLEETGIKVKNLRYIKSQAWPFPDQLMLGFMCEYESGEIKVQQDELRSAGWFSKNQLPKIPSPGSVAYSLINEALNMEA